MMAFRKEKRSLHIILQVLPICPTYESIKAMQVGFHSRLYKGVTIEQAIAIFVCIKPSPMGSPCHPQMKAFISHHHKCYFFVRDLSILDQFMLERTYYLLTEFTCIDNEILLSLCKNTKSTIGSSTRLRPTA